MSSQNVGTTVVYMAYNTSTGAYVTGDQANHTLKLVKDGTEASPTNASAEVDSTNAPGAYKLALTAAETQFGTVWLGGKSSTSNVIIIPITVTFEILPTALDANNFVKADVEDWKGTNVTAATAGIPDVNAKNINNVSASSVTTINANIGETQPINFTGTGASALVKSDMQDIAGSAVSTSTAQIGANMVNVAGSAVSTSSAQIGVNAVQIGGSATAGTNIGKTGANIGRGTVSGSPTTTNIPTSAFSPGVGAVGQFVGRTMIFDGNTTTTALQGQATNITASTNSATPVFTVTALTTAPSSGDTFSVV